MKRKRRKPGPGQRELAAMEQVAAREIEIAVERAEFGRQVKQALTRLGDHPPEAGVKIAKRPRL